jgi:hypothetical protein
MSLLKTYRRTMTKWFKPVPGGGAGFRPAAKFASSRNYSHYQRFNRFRD